jgi:hypothetical protein
LNRSELIGLVSAYVLTGALAFTVAITLGSLAGWIEFKDGAQQRTLFGVLVLQIALIAVGWFGNFLEFDLSAPASRIEEIATSAVTADLPVPQERDVTALESTDHREGTTIAVVRSQPAPVPSNSGIRSFVLQCPEGYRPVGIDPSSSFPARIDVERGSGTWIVTFLNLHGKDRPVGTANVNLVCAAQ